VFGFSEDNFLPRHAASFMMKACEKFFIECYSPLHILPELLREEKGLGSHTGVMVFCPFFALEYLWFQSKIRPWGEKVCMQCKACHRLKSLSFERFRGKHRANCKCGASRLIKVHKSMASFAKSEEGWASRFVYGEQSDVDSVKKAPRSSYNVM
jgi:hypothetical protein